jgi:hypothetical protein
MSTASTTPTGQTPGAAAPSGAASAGRAVRPPRRPPALRRIGATAAVLIVLGLALASCGGVIGSLLSTEDGLRNAGYTGVSVNVYSSDDVRVDATTSSPVSPAAFREVGGIVWHDLHERFDTLEIVLTGTNGTQTTDVSFDQLQTAFGPRDPSYNTTSVQSSLLHVGIVVVIAIIVVVILAVVLIVVLVRRSSRRRRARVAAYQSGGGPWGGPGGGGPGGPWSPGPAAGAPWGPPQAQGGPWGQGPPGRGVPQGPPQQGVAWGQGPPTQGAAQGQEPAWAPQQPPRQAAPPPPGTWPDPPAPPEGWPAASDQDQR